MYKTPSHAMMTIQITLTDIYILIGDISGFLSSHVCWEKLFWQEVGSNGMKLNNLLIKYIQALD